MMVKMIVSVVVAAPALPNRARAWPQRPRRRRIAPALALATQRRESAAPPSVIRGIPGVIALLPQSPSFVSLPFSICLAPARARLAGPRKDRAMAPQPTTSRTRALQGVSEGVDHFAPAQFSRFAERSSVFVQRAKQTMWCEVGRGKYHRAQPVPSSIVEKPPTGKE